MAASKSEPVLDMLADPGYLSETAALDELFRLRNNLSHSRPLRLAAQENLEAILSRGSKDLYQKFSEKLTIEAGRSHTSASADTWLLLQWTNTALTISPSSFLGLAEIQANLLYRIVVDPVTKPPLRRVAVRQTRTALVQLARSNAAATISAYTSEKLLQSLPGLLIVGQLVGAAADVSGEVPEAGDILVSDQSNIAKAYSQQLLSTKLAPEALHILPFLSPFFTDLFSQVVFDENIVPSLQKGLLRSPETVIQYILPAILDSMSASLTADLATKSLAMSLVSNLSSSNLTLRQNCVATYRQLLEKSPAPFLDDLLKYLSKATNSEQRQMAASILMGAPLEAGATELATAAAKEASDTGLHVITRTLVRRLGVSDVAKTAFQKGVADSNPPLRREWICALAQDPSLVPEDLKPSLSKAWQEISSNVGGSIASKVIPAAWAILLIPGVVPNGAQVGQVFEARTYQASAVTSNPEHQVLCVRAASRRAELGDPSGLPALVYISSSAQTSATRIKASNLTKGAIAPRPKLQLALVSAIEQALHDTSFNKSLVPIMNSFTDAVALVKVFVLAHDPRALVKGGWINLVLRAKLDPGNLIRKDSEEVMNMIVSEVDIPTNAWEALATAAFVAPDSMAPLITSYLQDNLQIITLSQEQKAVLAAKDGEIVKLPPTHLSSKGQTVDDWEAQVRAEVAKKSGKLTKEEQALLEEQTAMRSELRVMEAKVSNAASVAKVLGVHTARGADTGAISWFPIAVDQLIKVAKADGLGASKAIDALNHLSGCLSSRFPNKSVVSPLLLQSTTSKIISLLYKLNPLADHRPLDPVSLVFILPILVNLLKTSHKTRGKSNAKTEDELEEEEEAQLLALGLLANQAEVLALVPRPGLVSALLELLVTAQDKNAVKDCLMRIAQGVPFDNDEMKSMLDSVVSEQEFLRSAVLEVLDTEVDLSDLGYAPQIDISRQIPEHATVASEIWEESSMKRPDNLIDCLALIEPFLGSSQQIRPYAAQAYASASIGNENKAFETLTHLYRAKKEPPPKILDEFGLEVKQKHIDPVPDRAGILLAIEKLLPSLGDAEILPCAEFVVADAVTDPPLAQEALNLGKQLIALHGKAHIDGLIPIFSNRNIVLYGWEALHLPTSDERLQQTVDQLLKSLKTCDNSERIAVADCLESLAPRINAQPVLENLLQQALSGTEPEDRRTAADGLAGLAGGLGLAVIGDYGIVRLVEQAVDDKRDPSRRHGAQLLVAALAQRFGRKFEPYALALMPEVLAGLGDGQTPVRDAASEAARAVMQHTTAFGVKRQVPLALKRLETNQWRSKKGAVELLGTMAYLDPHQLATSLSVVVPELVGVLNDTHREVRAAAKGSLQTFGDVIENPEIRALVPELLDAIGDPPAKTETALTALLRTRFVHYVDSPSLALVICVVQRGLRDRSAAIKRKACQIVGNMSILAAGPDLIPYLPTILTDLNVAMTDPVPATCATACKALGVLVQKLGEDHFPMVIPQMLETLAEPSKSGDRWGTAQGLAEVLHGLGIAKLEATLPAILQGLNSPKAHIRQGFAPLLLLLPSSFGPSLIPYLSQLVTPLLRALADSFDDIREMAIKAGRRIVRSYAQQSIELLLPELERGLGSAAWRVRLASVELVGDLLMQLSGRTVVDKSDISEAPAGEEGGATESLAAKEMEVAHHEEQSAEDDDKAGSAEHPLDHLHLSNGDRILAGLFMCRADVVPAVRQAALETWMSLVPNTPRAIKSILPTVVKVIVLRLGDSDAELREIGSKALAELVRRVSGALPQILPTLENLDATDPDARLGVCLGLVELISASPVDILREYHSRIAQLVRAGLTDSSCSTTREAATKALDALHSALGDGAGDLLPGLVVQAADGDAGALAALKEMPGAFSKAVPIFLEEPLTDEKAIGLSELAHTAGPEIWQYIEGVVDALLPVEKYAPQLDSILAVCCPESHLLSAAKGDEQIRYLVFARMATLYITRKEEGVSVDLLFASDWLNLALLALEEEGISSRNAAAMIGALAAAATKAQQAQLATPAYNALRIAGTPTPGLDPPNFILPLFVQGLVAGTNLEKEHGAFGLSEIVHRVPASSLKPVVTQITGPLIRVVGERTAPEVKAAVLYTLHELLKTVPTLLRPFLPQLQRTFAKNLSESSAAVRGRAAGALGELIKHQSRVDPLVKELITGVNTHASNPGVYQAYLQALLEVVVHAGQHIGEAVRKQIVEVVEETNISGEYAATLAHLAAALAKLEPELARQLVKEDSDSVGSVLAAQALWVHAPEVATTISSVLISVSAKAACQSQQTFSDVGVRALGAALLKGELSPENASLAISTLVQTCKKSENRSLDTRRLSLIALGAAARKDRSLIESHIDDLVVPLFAAARDTLIPIKLAAEKTFLYVFDLIGRQDAQLFNEWFEKNKDSVPEATQRSLPEWVRRVALRHAAREAENDDNAGYEEDIQEILSIL